MFHLLLLQYHIEMLRKHTSRKGFSVLSTTASGGLVTVAASLESARSSSLQHQQELSLNAVPLHHCTQYGIYSSTIYRQENNNSLLALQWTVFYGIKNVSKKSGVKILAIVEVCEVIDKLIESHLATDSLQHQHHFISHAYY